MGPTQGCKMKAFSEMRSESSKKIPLIRKKLCWSLPEKHATVFASFHNAQLKNIIAAATVNGDRRIAVCAGGSKGARSQAGRYVLGPRWSMCCYVPFLAAHPRRPGVLYSQRCWTDEEVCQENFHPTALYLQLPPDMVQAQILVPCPLFP